VLRLTAILGFI